MKTILFFGDSLTAGYGLSNPDEESFPARIGEKIQREKFRYKIVNAGRSGDTSFDGLSRLEYWLSQPVDVFVLELGINDIIRGHSPSSTKQNLDQILKRTSYKFPNCKMAIMGMDAPASIRAQRIEASNSLSRLMEFKSMYSDLAKNHNAALVPFFLQGVAGVKSLNLVDGLHPNSEGYKVIADHAWVVIKDLL
jgi:acyl-CoA thioesterase I